MERRQPALREVCWRGEGEELSKKEGKTKRTHGKQCDNCTERGGGGGRGNRMDKWKK